MSPEVVTETTRPGRVVLTGAQHKSLGQFKSRDGRPSALVSRSGSNWQLAGGARGKECPTTDRNIVKLRIAIAAVFAFVLPQVAVVANAAELPQQKQVSVDKPQGSFWCAFWRSSCKS